MTLREDSSCVSQPGKMHCRSDLWLSVDVLRGIGSHVRTPAHPPNRTSCSLHLGMVRGMLFRNEVSPKRPRILNVFHGSFTVVKSGRELLLGYY